MQTYDEFIPEQDIFQFEIDMEEGKYKSWVEKYPENIYTIFGAYLLLNSEQTEDDIIYFVKQGIDLNKQSKVYWGDMHCNTPLTFACEYHNVELVRILLEAGACANTPTIYGDVCYPLYSVLQGHSASYIHPSHAKRVIDIVALLRKHGLKPEGQIPLERKKEFLGYENDEIMLFVC
uniref:Uncharacterized protein n=1 Tax=viral metagenome TaxID=1070528 RepID=A0A6C0KSJ9_9ZZZZ